MHFIRVRISGLRQLVAFAPTSPWANTRHYSTVGPKSGPLNGLRVLDVSRILAGPFCTQLLADCGADVIKVEQPEKGDDTRQWQVQGESMMWNENASSMSLYFSAVNRNKRSITLDLKKSTGKRILHELAQRCDVFVENFIPGKAEEMGFGYEELHSINDQLVYASISGYGASGPYAKRAAYDAIVASEAGLMHITGEADGKPLRPGLGMVDMSTGMLMYGAILTALRARDSTGKGQKLETSLFETQISLLINVGANWLNLGIEGKRYGAAHPSICPYDTYKTKDGYFALGANNEKQWRILCRRLGREDLLEDVRFRTNQLRVKYREALDTTMTSVMLTKTNGEWRQAFEDSGLANGPVNTIEQAFEHPQVVSREMVVELKSLNTESGSLSMIGPAVKFSATQATLRTEPPLLSQHTVEILLELGYTTQQVADLKQEGVV